MYVIFEPDKFYANYFWSVKPGSKIREDVFVKTYLSNFFTFKDFVQIYKMVGEEKLLKYAEEINMKDRIEMLIMELKRYGRG